jgi:hypothetical protein
MRLLVVDGPEKAGKTTFIQAFLEYCAKGGVRATAFHWGNPGPEFHSFCYTEPLAQIYSNQSNEIVVWDRSWASEVVYPALLPSLRRKGRVFWDDKWLAAWSYDRAMANIGVRLMLLGPSVDELRKWRDNTDHPCDPGAERQAFQEYGSYAGWIVFPNLHSEQYVRHLCEGVWMRLHMKQDIHLSVPEWAGPFNAKVIFIGESRNEKLPKAWLPFTSSYTTNFGRAFGADALKYGWTNANHVRANDGFFREFLKGKIVVACGTVAQDLCKEMGVDYLEMLHPAYGFRWGQAKSAFEPAIENLKIEINRRIQNGESK